MFPGICDVCDMPFATGDEISFRGLSEYGAPGRSYRHAPRCPDDTPAPSRFEGTTLDAMGF